MSRTSPTRDVFDPFLATATCGVATAVRRQTGHVIAGGFMRPALKFSLKPVGSCRFISGALLTVAACLVGACNGSPTGPSRPEPGVVIDSPSGGTVALKVTFRWHLENPRPGETYRYEVRLDKGIDACDNAIEEAFSSDGGTCLALDLPTAIYTDVNVDFAVRATDSQGRSICTRGQRLFVSPNAPPSPQC